MNLDLTEFLEFLVKCVKQVFDFMKNITFTVNGTTVSYFWGVLSAFAAERILSALLKRKDDEET